MKEIGFTYNYKPEVKISPEIPESITIDGLVKCPQCGFPVTDKAGCMVAGGSSRSKYYCKICGYSFGDSDLK